MRKTIKDMSLDELVKDRKKFQDWIDGSENDGRLSAGSSAHLDYCGDMIEEITEEIERRL